MTSKYKYPYSKEKFQKIKSKKELLNQCIRCTNVRDNGTLCNNCKEKDKNKRIEFQNKGICGDCRKRKLALNKKRCQICIDKAKKSVKEKRERYKIDKKCGVCGRIADKSASFCKLCSAKKIQEKRKYFDRGLCRTCIKPLPDGSKFKKCALCRDKDKIKRKSRLEKIIRDRLCTICKNPLTVENKKCGDCLLKDRAKYYFGDADRYLELLEILERQNYKCAYSGKDLVLGVNAWIDHIHPISLNGSNEISNLQWVDETINIMKRNLLETEFFKIIKMIYKYRNLDNY